MWYRALDGRAAARNQIGLWRGCVDRHVDASANSGRAGGLSLNARANDLPFSGSRFDVIYSVNAIHHFDDPKEFIMDAGRLLRPGGCLATIGIDPRAIRKRYPYDYFEGAFELDMRRYPSFGQLVDWSSEAGLDVVELRIVECSGLKFKGREVLTDRFGRTATPCWRYSLTRFMSAGWRRSMPLSKRTDDVEFHSDLLFGMVSRLSRSDAPSFDPKEQG